MIINKMYSMHCLLVDNFAGNDFDILEALEDRYSYALTFGVRILLCSVKFFLEKVKSFSLIPFHHWCGYARVTVTCDMARSRQLAGTCGHQTL